MNDKKHGFGKYRWADGRQYIGYWFTGKQDGFGKYILSNGSIQYGIWQKGKRTNWLTEDQIQSFKSNQDFLKVIDES